MLFLSTTNAMWREKTCYGSVTLKEVINRYTCMEDQFCSLAWTCKLKFSIMAVIVNLSQIKLQPFCIIEKVIYKT